MDDTMSEAELANILENIPAEEYFAPPDDVDDQTEGDDSSAEDDDSSAEDQDQDQPEPTDDDSGAADDEDASVVTPTRIETGGGGTAAASVNPLVTWVIGAAFVVAIGGFFVRSRLEKRSPKSAASI